MDAPTVPRSYLVSALRVLQPAIAGLILLSGAVRADIYTWEYVDANDPSQGVRQSMTLAPDGAGLEPGPWLEVAGVDLTRAYLRGFDLPFARFSQTTILVNADLSQANLYNAGFRADLTGARFTDANLQQAEFSHSILTGADFTGADISGITFWNGNNLTDTQLYSTASYQSGDLAGITFNALDLAGWDFSGQYLNSARFRSTRLADCNFSGRRTRSRTSYI